jgi:glutamate-5-semialdehyde dehydrogenase
MELREQFERVKAASKELALISDERKNNILEAVAEAIMQQKDMLLEENAKDLARMEKSNPLYDRLQLTEKRLEGIASDMRHVATLENPLGKVLKHKILDNGLVLSRVSVPFGVIGVIYEARPNVSFDVFSLCFKSGNACVLKGGKDADDSNRAIIGLIHKVLEREGVNPSVVELLPATHAHRRDAECRGLYRRVHPPRRQEIDTVCARHRPRAGHRNGCRRGEHLFR